MAIIDLKIILKTNLASVPLRRESRRFKTANIKILPKNSTHIR